MIFETSKFITKRWEETFRIGQHVAPLLESGDVLALIGNLGSGKTVFTKGVCHGLHVTDVVTSPTFTLIHEYKGRLPVYHFDFYRLNSPEEIEMLDLDGYFNQSGISIIEWADKGETLLPDSVFKIVFERDSDGGSHPDRRHLSITAPSQRGLERIKA
jgi:tRNA threonylcarbamoyladenosine biosynthesis protein TsaE